MNGNKFAEEIGKVRGVNGEFIFVMVYENERKLPKMVVEVM